MTSFRALPEPVAFVLTSGGARCSAQVGMLRALTEGGAAPDLLVGSSFGAVNAAVAAAAEPSELARACDELEVLWTTLGEEPPLASPGTAAVRRLTMARVASRASLQPLLRSVVSDEPMRSLRTPLHLVAMDLATGMAHDLSDHDTLPAVLAASAVPILLNPVTLDDRVLVDGGFADGFPVTTAVRRGARSIIALDTGSSALIQEEPEDLRWWEVGATAYLHMMRGQAALDLAQAASQVPVVSISTDSGNVFDFTSVPDMIAAGLEAVERARPLLDDARRPGLHGIPIGFEDNDVLAELVRRTTG